MRKMAYQKLPRYFANRKCVEFLSIRSFTWQGKYLYYKSKFALYILKDRIAEKEEKIMKRRTSIRMEAGCKSLINVIIPTHHIYHPVKELYMNCTG